MEEVSEGTSAAQHWSPQSSADIVDLVFPVREMLPPTVILDIFLYRLIENQGCRWAGACPSHYQVRGGYILAFAYPMHTWGEHADSTQKGHCVWTDWQPVQGLLRLSPANRWDNLQLRRDPKLKKMSSGTFGRQLVACLLNVSEARRKDLVEVVAKAALYNATGIKREGTTVLNIFNDHDYNRSVITIVSSIHSIREAVLSACETACGLIDMRAHAGVHPCMGAVDLIPIYPLGEEVGVQECVQEARAVAQGLTERVRGTSAFLFGWADSPLQRGLAHRRKEMGWFKKTPDRQAIRPDMGPQPQRQYGLTGVGASPYVMNCNVTIDTQDITLGRKIAKAIRESSPGGLPGVQVLALPHEGAVEIACNVESMKGSPPANLAGEPWPCFSIDGQPYCHAPASLITARVAELAGTQGVGIKGTALVGFTPHECRGLAEFALSQGISEFWKEQHRIRM